MKTSWSFQKLSRCLLMAGLTICSGMVASLPIVTFVQGSPPPPPPPPPPPGFGVPLAGLASGQLVAWKNGQGEFTAVETPGSGLGPIFNRNSCVACHSGPAVGGSSPINTTRFGRTTNGVFDPLTSLGGSLLQTQAINPRGLEHIPPQANTIAQRNTPPLFGLGLIEAIPDATILSGVRARPVNGVLGRAAMITDPVTNTTRVGRFGWKAQQATLLAFSADAYVNEIGITNRVYPNDNAPNGNEALLAQLEPPNVPTPNDQPDPTTGKAGIDRLTDFMQLTAPPPQQSINVSTAVGAKLFVQVGCANCHTPTMTTGTNTVAVLSSKTVFVYSDFLLHDMGSLGDGIAQGAAGPTEMKTPPLWGLGASAPYLHDGRAPTIDAAIKGHDGEAAPSKTQYLGLTSDQQALLIQFLHSI